MAAAPAVVISDYIEKSPFDCQRSWQGIQINCKSKIYAHQMGQGQLKTSWLLMPAVIFLYPANYVIRLKHSPG